MRCVALQIVVAWCLVQGFNSQMRRTNDRQGQCTYSFTVPGGPQGGCPDTQDTGSTVLREMETLQTRISLLEKAVNQLLGAEGKVTPASSHGADIQSEVQRLRMEKDEWEGQRGSLEMAYTDLLKDKHSLQEEKQQLSQRLERAIRGHCPQGSDVSRPMDQQLAPRQVSRWGTDQVAYQELKSELTALPASRMIPETQLANHSVDNIRIGGDCGELVWIGEPKTYRKADSIAGKYGVWMRDPEPLSPYTLDTIWRVNTVGADIRQVFEYENLDQLVKGYPAKVYILPRSMESNGAVVYKGSIYYPRRKSRILAKYDLKTESVAVQKELPNAGYHGQYPYSWGGYTDIDLAVDELGLWVIYSTEKAKGSIVISQLDPKTLEVKQSWKTQIRKQSVANAFMICGTLYTVGSYSSSNTTINFAFDSHTGVQHQVSLSFKNQYGYASMIDYNPTEKKLYGWDNYNMVAYDVRLSKM